MDNSFGDPNAGGGFTSFSTTFFDVFDTDKNCKKLNCDPSRSISPTRPMADPGIAPGPGTPDLGSPRHPGGNQFAVFFNLNETGNDGLSGIDLLAWGQVTLEKTTGRPRTSTSRAWFWRSDGKNLSAAFGAPTRPPAPAPSARWAATLASATPAIRAGPMSMAPSAHVRQPQGSPVLHFGPVPAMTRRMPTTSIRIWAPTKPHSPSSIRKSPTR